MQRFETNRAILQERLNQRPPRQRPLVTVVVSLWETDQSIVGTKMLARSVTALLEQAQAFDLDFIAIANNGGGHERMVPATEEVLRAAFHDVHVVKTTRQTACDVVTPWSLELRLADGSRQLNHNRCFFVIQPLHELNKGKIRALRDVAHALRVEILNGYTPDAVLQIDVESILAFRPSGLRFRKSPFQTLYDALKRRKLVAIGTKDRFGIVDPLSGKPLDLPVPLPQELFVQATQGKREDLFTLPGGALLTEPEYYVAGMEAIAQTTPGIVGEDYLFTQILRAHCRNGPFRIYSTTAITHFNRTFQGKAAVAHMARWRRQRAAVDEIFSDLTTAPGTLSVYTRLIIKSRRRLVAKDPRAGLRQIVEDVQILPRALRLLGKADAADILHVDV
jgi:hypothetical protein